MDNIKVLDSREVEEELESLRAIAGESAAAKAVENANDVSIDNIAEIDRCEKCGLSFNMDEFRDGDDWRVLCKRCRAKDTKVEKPKVEKEIGTAEIGAGVPVLGVEKINEYERILKLDITSADKWDKMPVSDRVKYQNVLADKMVAQWEKGNNPMTWIVLVGAKMVEDNIRHLEGVGVDIDLTGFQKDLWEQKDELDLALADLMRNHPEIMEKWVKSPWLKLGLIVGSSALKVGLNNMKKKAGGADSGSK